MKIFCILDLKPININFKLLFEINRNQEQSNKSNKIFITYKNYIRNCIYLRNEDCPQFFQSKSFLPKITKLLSLLFSLLSLFI
jgi:hypothetical protein